MAWIVLDSLLRSQLNTALQSLAYPQLEHSSTGVLAQNKVPCLRNTESIWKSNQWRYNAKQDHVLYLIDRDSDNKTWYSYRTSPFLFFICFDFHFGDTQSCFLLYLIFIDKMLKYNLKTSHNSFHQQPFHLTRNNFCTIHNVVCLTKFQIMDNGSYSNKWFH